MRYQSEQEFSKMLRAQGATGAILLCGSEDFLIENWRKTILKQFGQEEGFNLQILDGNPPDFDAVYDATQMLPVFAAEKCVYLADLDPGKLYKNEMEQLEQILTELPPECTLLITSRGPAFDSTKAASKKLMALVDEHGAVLPLDGRDKNSMVRFVQSLAKKGGTTISPANSRYLLDLCEDDMRTLEGEMGKISAYAQGQEINKEHIDAVASPKTEARVFDLSRAITSGDGQKAMTLVQDLFYLRENPVAITAALITSYTDIYRARIAKDQGKTPEDVLQLFSYRGMQFRVRNAFRVNMSTQGVRQSLEHLYRCEEMLKSTGIDTQWVLEKTVLALLSCRKI